MPVEQEDNALFLSPEELNTVLYNYQLDEITEGDEDIVLAAIEAAILEVQSYFTPNYKREWGDGRLVYDVEAIFEKRDAERNPLLLQHCKTIAAWNVVQLSNVDMIYDQVRERYDRAVEWLTLFAKGEVSIAGLPTKDITYEDEDGNPIEPEPFRFGSRRKFRYE